MLTPRSLERLTGVDPRLQALVKQVASVLPIQVTEGLRSADKQAELVRAGRSKTQASKHLTGHAVDLVWTQGKIISWEARNYFLVAGAMFAYAHLHGIPLRWGGDWDQDFNFSDQTFNDYVHFEVL